MDSRIHMHTSPGYVPRNTSVHQCDDLMVKRLQRARSGATVDHISCWNVSPLDWRQHSSE